MDINNYWLDFFYNKKEKVFEDLNNIYQDMLNRIKILEKENSELKNNTLYKKLVQENSKLNKLLIIQDNYSIDENLLNKAQDIITEHYNKCHENKIETKIGKRFHYKINQPNGVTTNGKYIVCDICKQEFLLNPYD